MIELSNRKSSSPPILYEPNNVGRESILIIAKLEVSHSESWMLLRESALF